MTVKDQLSARASDAHRWGLTRAREAIHFSLHRRDRRLPHLAELRNLKVPGAAGPLDARLYVSDGAPTTGPLLLFFHGGGFVTCDLDTHDAFCARLANSGGFRVLSCRYRLAPEAAFPAQADDALAAARWVTKNAASLGSHQRQVAIGGDSAGGYLAVATAARMPKAFTAQILVYPLLHLEDDIWAKSMSRDTRVLGRLAVRYIEAQLAQGGVRAPSLLDEATLTPLPTLIAAGGPLDPCSPDCHVYAQRLAAMGAQVTRLDYPALIHGFINLTHTSAAARKAVEEIGDVAEKLLRG